MKSKTYIFSILLTGLFIITACSPQLPPITPAANTSPDDMMEKTMSEDASVTAEQTMPHNSPSSEMGSSSIEMTMDWPNWTSTPLMDVNTGETFKIQEHQGKVILVETLAMWCSNCMKQQQQVKILHEKLSSENNFVSVGLGIDINEKPEDLQKYTQKNGFDWIYAVATRDVAQEIGTLYGAQFLNPPSTPILLIAPTGEVHLLPFGIKSAEEIETQVRGLLQ